MLELSEKILELFPGKVVRKDLTSLMKKSANVPTYVLEYLLGMYCATNDEETIQMGMQRIKDVIAKNYVRPDQSEYIKSKIKENGSYTIIDKLTVELIEREDKYIAHFTNLRISPFVVSSDFVVHNEKLLTGGVWCIMKIKYTKTKNEPEYELTYDYLGREKKKKIQKKVSRYDSPFSIESLKAIQLPSFDIYEIIDNRKHFTNDEWISLLLKSCGYNPDELTRKQKFHYLLRFVPLAQKNYNLVELGPRGTGKSHVYSELSPHSILLSSGSTTVSNMFYNLSQRKVGIVGSWDCIAFDEVGGLNHIDDVFLQTMKNYMANGSFARGTTSINADASIVFEGNTLRPVVDMLINSTLFEPFPSNIRLDSAFFDRIHAYLPGWETPKLRRSLFTDDFGLISDCFSEYCHALRLFDFSNDFATFFTLNSKHNTRDEIGVRRTFSGLAKLIYPDRQMSKEETRELLEYCIEGRRRVKEQLRRMNPSEYSDVDLGYIDNETGQEYVVLLPEQGEKKLISHTFETPGYVYGIGKSTTNNVGIYRLENKLIEGTGKLENKNIEGITQSGKTIKDSLNAAFNYFVDYYGTIIGGNHLHYDYTLYYNDLQNKGLCEELSVAEVVGLCSALSNKSVMPGLVVCGRVVMSGSMMPLSTSLEEIFLISINAGAKRLLLPEECYEDYRRLPQIVTKDIIALFYKTPIDAATIALDLGE